jgi:hypothetical protein
VADLPRVAITRRERGRWERAKSGIVEKEIFLM